MRQQINVMSIPHHSLLNEMVALEQESWQVDDYLPVKTTPELHEYQINIELSSIQLIYYTYYTRARAHTMCVLISGTLFGTRSIYIITS
jgi:hypothetical protein